jgi:hypothetical protein
MYSGASASNTFSDSNSAKVTPFSLEKFDDTARSTDDEESISSVHEGIEILGAEHSPAHFLGWLQLWSGRIVRSRIFKRGVLFNILLFSVFVGLSTFDVVRENPAASKAVNLALRFFRMVFTIEILLDLIHYQGKAIWMGWIVFDIFLIILSWSVGVLSILVARSFRLIRAFRKASVFPDLKHVVKTILHVIPKVLAILLIIALIMYIFAVIVTDMYEDLYEKGLTSENYFGRLDITAFTLFRIMTLDNWTVIVEEVMAVYPSSVVIFISLIITTLVSVALVIAVVSDSFNSLRENAMVKALEDPRHSLLIQGSKSKEIEIALLEERISKLTSTVESLIALHRHAQQTTEVSIENLTKQ